MSLTLNTIFSVRKHQGHFKALDFPSFEPKSRSPESAFSPCWDSSHGGEVVSKMRTHILLRPALDSCLLALSSDFVYEGPRTRASAVNEEWVVLGRMAASEN